LSGAFPKDSDIFLTIIFSNRLAASADVHDSVLFSFRNGRIIDHASDGRSTVDGQAQEVSRSVKKLENSIMCVAYASQLKKCK
jgi:hypothetical protein